MRLLKLLVDIDNHIFHYFCRSLGRPAILIQVIVSQRLDPATVITRRNHHLCLGAVHGRREGHFLRINTATDFANVFLCQSQLTGAGISHSTAWQNGSP